MRAPAANRKKLKLNRLGLALGLALAALAGQAAETPNIGDALRQAEPPAVPPQPAPALPAIGGVPIEPPMQALPGGQAQVQVDQFVIVGNRVIDTPTLLALVQADQGKRLSLADLDAIATRLTRYYRSQGYFVARAYVPAQEVSGGRITLRMVEGNYGQFHLKNQSLVRDDLVQGMLDDIKDRDIVSLDTLERAMLIINDTPGVQIVRADVMPGTKVGTSDFAVGAAATAAYNGFVMLDNFGSRYTGRNRLSFNLDANSPTGRGDRLSASGLASLNGDIVNGRLGYSTLLAPNGLRGELAVSQTQYELGDIYERLDARGTARAVDAFLTYPIRRIRAQTIQASLNVGYKDLEDEVRSTGVKTPKDLTSATLGLLVRDESPWLGFDGLTQANAELSFGDLRIKDAAARSADAAGPRTEGDYRMLAASLTRVSLLPQRFIFTASLRWQRSLGSKNLDGSERMAVSGSGGVMAYPTGELTGTNATFARLELSRPFPQWEQLRSSWLVFADWGKASAARAVSAGDRRREIGDVGLGFTASKGGGLLKVYVAHRLDKEEPLSEPTPRNRVLAQAGWVF